MTVSHREPSFAVTCVSTDLTGRRILELTLLLKVGTYVQVAMMKLLLAACCISMSM